MLWQIYLRKGKVFVPTVAKTEAGFFMDIEPVDVLESTNYHDIEKSIKNMVGKGNPFAAAPARATFPKPVVLEYANVKSWSAFEKGAYCWKIVENDTNFQLFPQRKSPSGGWENDPAESKTFNGDNAIDEIASCIANQINGRTNQ